MDLEVQCFLHDDDDDYDEVCGDRNFFWFRQFLVLSYWAIHHHHYQVQEQKKYNEKINDESYLIKSERFINVNILINL